MKLPVVHFALASRIHGDGDRLRRDVVIACSGPLQDALSFLTCRECRSFVLQPLGIAFKV